jgi:hypothetical protein
MFVVLGSVLFLTGTAMSLCILMAGRSLPLRKRYTFVFVTACVECLFIAFGTVLGVFTIIVLSRESARALFSQPTAPVPG